MKYFKYDSIFLNISLVKKYLEIFHVWKKYFMPLARCRHVPVSTGIFPHSLPEWGFKQDLGFCGFAFALKLPEWTNTNLLTVRAKLGQTPSFPNGPRIWFTIGQ